MAGQLTCRALFGVNGNARNNALAVEEDVTIYPSGGYLVKYNAKTRSQEAIVQLTGSGLPSADRSAASIGSPAGALALALSPTRRTFVVAERSSNSSERVTVSLYQCRTMSKKKVIVVGQDLGGAAGTDVLALSLSFDDSLLAVLGGGPQYYLALYNVDKGKLVARAHLSGVLGVRTSDVGGTTVGHLMAEAAGGVDMTESLYGAAERSASALGLNTSLNTSVNTSLASANTSYDGAASPGGQGQGEVPPPQAHLSIGGMAFAQHTSDSPRIAVWGTGVLAMLTLQEASEESGQATLAVVPPHPSIQTLAAQAASAASHVGEQAGAQAHEQVAMAVRLAELEAKAEAAQEQAAAAAAAAEEATAAIPAGGNPADSPIWVIRTQEAGDTREAAAAAQHELEQAQEQVGAAASDAAEAAFLAHLTTALTFTTAGWLPPPANAPGGHNNPATGELLVACSKDGEIVVVTSVGLVLGRVEDAPRDGFGITTVVGYSGELAGFVTGAEAGRINVYRRKAVPAPLGSKGKAKAAGSGARAVAASSRPTTATAVSAPEALAVGGSMGSEYGFYFTLSKSIIASAPGLDSEDNVSCMCTTPSNDKAVLALSGTQLMCLDIANAHLKDENSAVTMLGPVSHGPAPPETMAAGGPPSPLSGKGRGASPKRGRRGQSGLNGSVCVITSMDVAVRKPILVTAGSDNTVRVWNFADKSCEITRSFPDPPTAVAVHPSGLHVIVAFHDRLRLFDVLLDELKDVREWPIKGTTEVKYSRGGAMFAVASTSGFVIQVYDAVTGTYQQTLRGHGARVTSIQWAYNDCTLLSVGADGAVYEWALADGKRSREALLKGCRFTGAAATKDGSTVYAVGEMTVPVNQAPSTAATGEGGRPVLSRQASGLGGGLTTTVYAMKAVDMATGLVTAEYPLPERPAGIAMSFAQPCMMFLGAAGQLGDGTVGVVRSLAQPLQTAEKLAAAAAEAAAAAAAAAEAAKPSEKGKGKKEDKASAPAPLAAAAPAVPTYGSATVPGMPGGNVVPGTSLGVSKLLLSHDDAHLFVAGLDGTVVVYDVRDREGKLPMSEFAVKMPWADEAALSLSDLAEKRQGIKELRDTLAELQASAEYASRMKDMEFNDAVKKLAERSQAELDAEKAHYELLSEEKADVEREYSERLSGLDLAHRAEIQKREALYQGKIMGEVERYQALAAEVEAAKAHWAAARQQAMASHNTYVARLTAEYESRLGAVRDKRALLTEEASGARRDWEEMRNQMEGDLDGEVEGLKGQYQAKLDGERDAALKFKGENGIMRKKFVSLGKEIEENKEAIATTLARHAQLRGVIDGLERDIAMLRGVIHEKDGIIGEREKRIFELKKKNQELEKFKFVLDVKIKELKGQIEPREAEIAALKKQIREVNAELEAYHKSNSALDSTIGQLRGEIDSLTTRSMDARMSAKKKEAMVGSFRADLYRVVQKAKTPEDFKSALDELVSLYVPKAMPPPLTDLAVVAESERQREQLEGQLKQLKSTSERNAVAHAKELASLINENMTLIESARSLREEVNKLRTEARATRLDTAQVQAKASMSASQAMGSGALASALASMASVPMKATGHGSVSQGSTAFAPLVRSSSSPGGRK